MSSSLSVSLGLGEIILVRYIESLLFVIGIIGSFLNIFLFSQRKFRSISCCTYFLSSSISAIVLLLIGVIPQIYALDHSPNPIFNRNFCKFRSYMGQLSAMLCRWLLTIACIDRCFLSSINARLRLFSTVSICRKVILILLIIWLIIPIHMLIFIDVRKVGYIVCMMSTNGASFYHTIYTIIAGGLIPSLIMLICTKILWTNIQLKKQRRQTIIVNLRETRRETRDIQVLIMLLLQVIIFIIFNFPYMCFNLYLSFTRSVINKSTDRLSIESFLQFFTEVVVFVYPSISFYSNTLVSKTFRNEFIILYCRIFPCIHRQRFPIETALVQYSNYNS